MCLKNNFEGENRGSNGVKNAKSPWRGNIITVTYRNTPFPFCGHREKLALKVPIMGYSWYAQDDAASGYRTLWSDWELDMHVKTFQPLD